MPVSSMLASLFVLLIFFLMLCGVIGSWSWLIWRVRSGQTIVPQILEPKTVPWGLGSVMLVVLTWLAINLGLITVYMLVTASGAPAAAPAVAKAGKAVAKAGKAVAKAGKAVAPAVERTLGFTEQMVVTSLINGALLLTLPLVLRFTSGARLADLGIERRRLGEQFLVGTVAFFVVSPFVYALNGLAILVWKPESHPLEKMIRNESSMGIAELAVLSAVLLAPAAEELIFRGVIQRWLSKLFNPRPVEEVGLEELAEPREAPRLSEAETQLELAATPAHASVTGFDENPFSAPSSPVGSFARTSRRMPMQPIVLTSTLFALVHFPQWPAPLAIFFLSLGLGFVFERSGSLIAAMVMHALFNGLGTLLLFVMILVGGVPAADAEPKKEKVKVNPPPSFIVPEPTLPRIFPSQRTGTIPHFWAP
ncbi:CPBP family intramembrane glutamic endopeptidase [Singulisphaera sp. GP187]|uniref:CPBP family intramembrane glutamic endopeptidase n=1 Tax=Singulisphaera sp. GP187 TaxID=1882752 RepID=UPI0020B1379D|nr:CPBP family intramembrane glutamic endopeptidase [Singulisphaera sp. GP187]